LKNKIILYLEIKKLLDNSYKINSYFRFTGKEEKELLDSFEINLEDSFFKEMNDFEELINKKDLFVLKPYSEYEIGKDIYDIFFKKNLRTGFEDFFNLLTRKVIDEFILVINSSDEKILNIPFELITKDRFFILENSGFNIVRTINENFINSEIKNMQPVVLPLKILFVTSLPENIDENLKFIEIEKEEISLIEAVGNLVSDKQVLIDFLNIASLKSIENALIKGKHDILHISGHGNKGFLLLENEEGNSDIISAKIFSDILKDKKSLRMVVLSACDSSEIAKELINIGIPAVIAMGFSILDENARLFTSCFYKNISLGKSISKTISNSRKLIYEKPEKLKTLSNYFLREWFIPHLYLNENIEKFIDDTKPIIINDYFVQKSNNLHYLKSGNGFIGRRKEIVELTKIFENRKATCIYGLGGVGKTTLAINFAANFKNSSYKVILFSGEITEKHILEKIIKEFNIENTLGILENSEMTSIEKLEYLIENYIKKEKIIFLFDNFEDNQKYSSKISSSSLSFFLEYLIYNASKLIRILFTTRYKLNLLKVDYWNINKMSFPEIYRMMNLFDSLREISLKNKKNIYDKLGGHPRFIELLSGVIDGDDLDSILLKLNDIEKYELSHDLFLDILWEKLNENEQVVLKYISVFRESVDLSFLEAVLPFKIKDIEEVINKLNKLSLLYLSEDKFFIHRLSSNYILTTKTTKILKKEINLNIADLYLDIIINNDETKINDVLNTRWHYIQAQEYYEAFRVTYSIDYLKEKGFADLILDLYKEFEDFELSEKDRAYLYHQIAVAYDKKSMYDDSLDYYNKALSINEKIKFLDGKAINLAQIGGVYRVLGEYDVAITYIESSIYIGKQIKNLTILTRGYYNIGEIFQLREDIKKAASYYDEALKFAQKNKELIDIANVYYDIATIYLNRDFVEGASHYANKSFKILKKIDENSNEYANILALLGFIDYVKDKYNESFELYKKSLDIFKNNDNLKGLGMVYHYLGLLKANNNEDDESIFYLKKSLKISKTTNDIKFLAEDYISIAKSYMKLENKEEFLINIFNAYKIFKKLKLEKKEYAVYLFYEFMSNTENEYETQKLLEKINGKVDISIFDEIFKDMMAELEKEE